MGQGLRAAQPRLDAPGPVVRIDAVEHERVDVHVEIERAAEPSLSLSRLFTTIVGSLLFGVTPGDPAMFVVMSRFA